MGVRCTAANGQRTVATPDEELLFDRSGFERKDSAIPDKDAKSSAGGSIVGHYERG